MITLKGKIITLRALEPEDLDKLYLWENDTALWPHGSTRAPLTRHQLWQYIDSYDGDIFTARQLRLMIIDNDSGEAIGTADIFDFDPHNCHAKTGIFIDKAHRRKGAATETLQLLSEYSSQCLGLHQLLALVRADNNPSIDLFKRAGFKSGGCLRSWIKNGHRYSDVLIFQKLFE